MSGRRELGDYQTPAAFADRVVDFLMEQKGVVPSVIIEPTCGSGHFVSSSTRFPASKIIGIEINHDYCEKCRSSILDRRVTIVHGDVFACSFKQYITEQDTVLVIGNPPWVTNSTLSSLGSDNVPKKSNFKAARGIDAITGASNFDICEAVILQVIRELCDQDAVICMLCKTSVARNVFEEVRRNRILCSYFEMYEFDASDVFGVSASACVLLLRLSKAGTCPSSCNVYDLDDPTSLKSVFGYSSGRFYSDLRGVGSFDGVSCFEWRQGVKHDCAKVMELSLQGDRLVNGNQTPVEIEPELVFPLVKSSMFKQPVINQFQKYVIVTQKKAGEDTAGIQRQFPQGWAYLTAHKDAFERRKSVIYQGAPPFSMFGIGDYAYSRYKVGVSGFYKHPLFSVLYSPDGKPVMTDDTSYFICFDEYDMAYTAMLLLNSRRVQHFLSTIAFSDAKRPYTKKVLRRLDFGKICAGINLSELRKTEMELELPPYIHEKLYDSFSKLTKSVFEPPSCKTPENPL